VTFGREERTYGPLISAKFHLDRCNVTPLQGENPKNLPVSKNNTGRLRFALSAVKTKMYEQHIQYNIGNNNIEMLATHKCLYLIPVILYFISINIIIFNAPASTKPQAKN